MESDAQLVSMLDTDPEEGMALIMEQYGGLVWAAAASRLASEQDVRECVNDTFAEFYFRRARYDPDKGPLGTWLAHIARRRAVDKWRAQRRFDADELPEDAPAPALPSRPTTGSTSRPRSRACLRRTRSCCA